MNYYDKALAILIMLFVISAAGADDAPQFLTERHAYVRGETVLFRIKVDDPADHIVLDVSGWFPRRVSVHQGTASYSIDTALLRAGDYEVRGQLIRHGQPTGRLAVFPITIAPKPNPQQFPIWHWGGLYSDLRWWTIRGFNGFRFGIVRDPQDINSRMAKKFAHLLDESVRLGVDMGAYFHPLKSERWQQEAQTRCLLQSHRRHRHAVYPREPAVLDHARRTADVWVSRFADYPAFRHILLSSEYTTPFCINDLAKTLAQQEAGVDLSEVLAPEWMPTWAVGKYAIINPAQIPKALQPQDGIISDHNSVYRFLKWWWERGHGTNILNAEMAKIIKARRPDILVWHDPYRLAPVYHSHTGLDAISTWTYGHPDIKQLSYTTILQAAAKRERQKVMQTITLFVYGRFVLPIRTPSAHLFSDQPGQDPYFTNAPDYAREAIWLVMSQRPDLLNFYNASTLQPDNPKLDPFITSPETFDAIGEVSQRLIQPYGPAILQSRRSQAKVAVLMSASAAWFHNSRSDTSHGMDQILPYCSLLLMNHIQFDIILDDDIVEGQLHNYQVLVIPRGDTLTESVYQGIVAFARSGKKVIADKTLRANVPGAIITDFDWAFERAVDGRALASGTAVTARKYQQQMEAYADRLTPLLAAIPRLASSNSKQVVINTLESDEVRYIFVINDKKTYGPRFGPWQLMTELGVRQIASVRVELQKPQVLYEAITQQPIPYTWHDDKAEFEITLPPARGRLIVNVAERIGRVELTAPERFNRNQHNPIVVRVLGVSGHSIKGTLPIKIEITDPTGRTSAYSRYSATMRSEDDSAIYEYSLNFAPALNDVTGPWTVRVTELVSGIQAEQKIHLH
jgi:hypothetical protein